jgi:hypothetical protein
MHAHLFDWVGTIVRGDSAPFKMRGLDAHTQRTMVPVIQAALRRLKAFEGWACGAQ